MFVVNSILQRKRYFGRHAVGMNMMTVVASISINMSHHAVNLTCVTLQMLDLHMIVRARARARACVCVCVCACVFVFILTCVHYLYV